MCRKGLPGAMGKPEAMTLSIRMTAPMPCVHQLAGWTGRATWSTRLRLIRWTLPSLNIACIV